MDEEELRRRESFQREMQERRERARERDRIARQNWQQDKEAERTKGRAEVAQIDAEASIEQRFTDAELSLNALKHEYFFGEWAKQNDHQRELELALIELSRMEHATNQEIRSDNNRHENAKDYKTHETDEFIRLKRALGQLTPEDREKFFREFEAEAKGRPTEN